MLRNYNKINKIYNLTKKNNKNNFRMSNQKIKKNTKTILKKCRVRKINYQKIKQLKINKKNKLKQTFLSKKIVNLNLNFLVKK